MLYIVRVEENGELFEYEYGNLLHAEMQYSMEKSASISAYIDGKETVLKLKINEQENWSVENVVLHD